MLLYTVIVSILLVHTAGGMFLTYESYRRAWVNGGRAVIMQLVWSVLFALVMYSIFSDYEAESISFTLCAIITMTIVAVHAVGVQIIERAVKPDTRE